MSDEFDDERRPRKKQKSAESGMSTVKLLLILFGSFAGLAVLVCCGVGAYGYFWFQKNLAQVALTTPSEIQKLTAEMTDIAIPPEFVPQHGSSLFGIKTVVYQWCPTGTCAPRVDGLGAFTLSSFHLNVGQNPGPAVSVSADDQFTDAALKSSWKEFTKTEHEFEIRGKKCKFYIVQGEQLEFDEMGESLMEDDEDGVTVITVDPQGEPAPTAPQASAAPKGTGRKSVQVGGTFPGKTDEVTLNLHLAPEDFQEEKILGMLRSIR